MKKILYFFIAIPFVSCNSYLTKNHSSQETFTAGIVIAGIVVLVFGWAAFREKKLLSIDRDKRIGQFKFQEFKNALESEKYSMAVIKESETSLLLRENITNGIETIGHIYYAINDSIKIINEHKNHNYYFEVEATVGQFSMKRNSTFFSYFDEQLCKKEIQTLKNLILNSSPYKNNIKKRQFR